MKKRIPFEVSIDPFYSNESMERFKKSAKQMEENGGTVHEIETKTIKGSSKNSNGKN